MTSLEFLQTLYGENASGYIVLWTSGDKKSRWYRANKLEMTAKEVEKIGNRDNIYFGVCLQDQEAALQLAKRIEERKGSKKKVTVSSVRGFSDSSVAIPGLWLDVDIQGPNHKQSNLPPNMDKAKELVDSFPLPPTLLVSTGGGLHVYWLFKELFVIDGDEDRQFIQDLSRRFQYTLQQTGKAYGWEIDSTHDLARVLRLPGTFNCKGPPVPVEVIHSDDIRYNPEDFDQYLLDIQNESQSESKGVDPKKVLAGVPEGSRDIELFKYASSLRARGIPREEAEILILQAAAKCSPPFPREEALTKLDSAWKYKEGSERTQNIGEAKARLQDITAENIFDSDIIGALAAVKELDQAEFFKIKQTVRKDLKGQVNFRDVEKLVTQKVAEKKNIHIVEPNEKPPDISKVFPGFPVEGIRIPEDWNVNFNGVNRWDPLKKTTIRACMVPVILTERLVNVETGREKMTLSYSRDGKWHYITANSSVLFNHSSIVQLRDRGLPVSSVEARALVKYLTDFESENLTAIPVRKSIHHMGWVEPGKIFLPGAEGDIILETDDEGGGLASIIGQYHSRGTLEEWIDLIKPLRDYSLARFILAAGFASPLLVLIGQRVFIIHLWGGSRGGKTATMKTALSIWGNPEGIMTSFNATKVAMENMAGLYADLPMGIDERQVVGDRQSMVESLVYTLGMGKGKARGTKTGGLQQFNTWRSIILTNGEQPLTTQSSATGVRTRILELYGIAIPDEAYSGKLHRVLGSQYGTAGPVFIKKIIEEVAIDPNRFKEDYETIMAELQETYGDRATSHLGYVATVIIADFYASTWIFGIEEEEAYKQAIQLGVSVLEPLESSTAMDDATRAYESFLSWYGVNAAHFTDEPPGGKLYGIKEPDDEFVYIYPTIFDQAMEEMGFNTNRILKDWAEQGYTKTETRGGKRQLKARKHDRSVGHRVYFVAVNLKMGNNELSLLPEEQGELF